MIILGIDTSAAPCCAAVYDSEKDAFMADACVNNALTHSVTMMPLVEDMLKNAELKIQDIDMFAVTAGPGSFTGLRIGISAVKALAYANKKQCVAVSANDSIAYTQTDLDGILCPCIDARVGQQYNAVYKSENGSITKLCEDRCIKADELAKELSEYKEKIYLSGDGARAVKAECDKAGVDAVIVSAVCRYQSGKGVCLASIGKEPVAVQELMPMYLKLPQAQRELMEKQKEGQK